MAAKIPRYCASSPAQSGQVARWTSMSFLSGTGPLRVFGDPVLHLCMLGLAGSVDQVLQVPAAAVQPELDGAVGGAQPLRDLCGGESVDVLEHHRYPLGV